MSIPATYIQTNFNGGEMSPTMMGRVDLQPYKEGASVMEGFFPMIQGPAMKLPGTIFVEHPAGECRLMEFVPFVTQAYMIEASALLFRFYTNDALIAGADVVHPWTLDQVRALDYQRSGDVLYLFHGDVKQHKLSRVAAEEFELADFDFQYGPFEEGNTDKTVTVTVTGTQTTTTIEASDPVFDPADVGGLFQIQALDFSDIRAWEPGVQNNHIGDKVRSEGKVYACVGLSSLVHRKTGTIPPTHTEGEEWDGLDGDKETTSGSNSGSLLWRYLYDRYGVVKITGYTSPTVVTGTVTRRLADSVESVATWRWAFGAFSDKNGYPTAAAIWNDRLVLAKGAVLYGSVVGDYENHRARDDTGQLTADMAFRVRLPDPNPIAWLRADKALLIGAADAEYAATRIQGSAIPQILRQSKYGSGAVRPVEAASRLLFVQRAGLKLRELVYSFQTDRYEAPDLTVMADHIGWPGIVDVAYQQEPHSLVWAQRGDGTLALMVYSPTQSVKGWARRPLGGDGVVEALRTMPNPEGEADQLWLSVNRDGVRTIERLAPFWQPGDDIETAYFVDCGLLFEVGAPATSFPAAVPHLAGKICKVLVDGSPHADVMVDGSGGFVLTRTASSSIAIGLGYSARLKTLRPEYPDNLGSWQGRTKRVPRFTARLLDTLGLSVAVSGGDARALEFRTTSSPMDEPVPLFTGDKTVPGVGRDDLDAQVEYLSDQPLPAIIVAHISQMTAAPL